MRRKSLCLGLALSFVLAFTLAMPALGSTDLTTEPAAKASAKSVAKKALKKSKKALRKSKKALAKANTALDVANAALDAAETATQGPPGPAGPAGPAGPTGPAGSTATTAQNSLALVGQQGRSIEYETNSTANSPVQVLGTAGLQITANCDGGDLDVDATTTGENGYISSIAPDPHGTGSNTNDDFNTDFDDETFPVLFNDDDDVHETVHYMNAGGTHVYIELWPLDDNAPFNCSLEGIALVH